MHIRVKKYDKKSEFACVVTRIECENFLLVNCVFVLFHYSFRQFFFSSFLYFGLLTDFQYLIFAHFIRVPFAYIFSSSVCHAYVSIHLSQFAYRMETCEHVIEALRRKTCTKYFNAAPNSTYAITHADPSCRANSRKRTCNTLNYIMHAQCYERWAMSTYTFPKVKCKIISFV